MSQNRHLCLHLHFYQPPRENPWLDEIEYQESAYPFHDWNERIDVECYRANGTSRILDAEGRVIDLANNYAKISFNFGPTLLSWMETKAPETYARLLEGDKLSQASFGGHGNAIAQCYNHTIMPLTNLRDKETQVLWGLHDFQRRFNRDPEAMWLPETAVDTETLEVLSANGMKYVILAPRQAIAIRVMNDEDAEWVSVDGEQIDPREPYLIRLPSGRSIAAYFYDGPISKAVAFEGLLHNGEGFASRLLSGFDERSTSQLLHIATDGETYGHHHKNGDMALAYALYHLEHNKLVTITNYGQYLEQNPPTKEARIHEHSSWSCVHGVERWRQDCGCNSGTKPGWHQRWRGPLRSALDRIRDLTREPFVKTLQSYGIDPWGARNDYIRVIENRTLANIDDFIKKWTGKGGLHDADISTILKALEAQRHLLLMYTSCAWFFDEVSGLETIQNLQYAYRAIELSERAFGIQLLDSFMKDLELAESNVAEVQNGRIAFEKYALPARVDNLRVGAHFAVASIFENFGLKNEIYNNKITLIEFQRMESGKAHLAIGHMRIRSRTTLDRNHILFGVLHFGDHNINGGIKKFETQEEYETLLKQAKSAFERADFPETMRVIDGFFGERTYSLKDLFKDEQRKFIEILMRDTMTEVYERLLRLYRNNYSFLTYLHEMRMPIPKIFTDVTEFIQNRGLQKTLASESPIRASVIRGYLIESEKWNVPLDGVGMAHELEEVLERRLKEFDTDDTNFSRLLEIFHLVKLAEELPTKVSLGFVQNWFWRWSTTRTPPSNPTAVEHEFENLASQLADRLKVRLPEKSKGTSSDEPGKSAISSHVPTATSKDVSV